MAYWHCCLLSLVYMGIIVICIAGVQSVLLLFNYFLLVVCVVRVQLRSSKRQTACCLSPLSI